MRKAKSLLTRSVRIAGAGPPSADHPAFDGEPVACEKRDGPAQLPGGDQVGTAAGDGGAGAAADDGGRQGDGQAVGDGADLGSEAGIGLQRLCVVGEEGGQGEPRIALNGHDGRWYRVPPSGTTAAVESRSGCPGTAQRSGRR